MAHLKKLTKIFYIEKLIRIGMVLEVLEVTYEKICSDGFVSKTKTLKSLDKFPNLLSKLDLTQIKEVVINSDYTLQILEILNKFLDTKSTIKSIHFVCKNCYGISHLLNFFNKIERVENFTLHFFGASMKFPKKILYPFNNVLTSFSLRGDVKKRINRKTILYLVRNNSHLKELTLPPGTYNFCEELIKALLDRECVKKNDKCISHNINIYSLIGHQASVESNFYIPSSILSFDKGNKFNGYLNNVTIKSQYNGKRLKINICCEHDNEKDDLSK
uniref:Uncharacterized protein n=1 Tax=Parastrongyloides trichosuri TaxID=131310 RepID=A0A0N4ZX92_PARTI